MGQALENVDIRGDPKTRAIRHWPTKLLVAILPCLSQLLSIKQTFVPQRIKSTNTQYSRWQSLHLRDCGISSVQPKIGIVRSRERKLEQPSKKLNNLLGKDRSMCVLDVRGQGGIFKLFELRLIMFRL